MRPRRLRQILNRRADAAVAFHEQDIARPQRATQLRRTARGKRFIARDRSVQITRDGQTDSFKHEALSVTSA